MEADGLIECFQASGKLRQINYLGDGELKLFLEIAKLDTYPQRQVKKQERVGNIPKTVRQWVEKTKKYEERTSFDGKTLGGKVLLTDNKTNKLHYHFDIAIRQRTGKNSTTLLPPQARTLEKRFCNQYLIRQYLLNAK